MRTTIAARQYIEAYKVSQDVINKAAQIAKADHRGFINGNDILEAKGRFVEAIDKGFGYLGTFKTRQEADAALKNCGKMPENCDV